MGLVGGWISSGAQTPRFFYRYNRSLPGAGGMADSVELSLLRAHMAVRRARVVGMVEAFVILGLISWLSLEYQHNGFMQAWIAQNFWPMGLLLNGTLAGLFVGLLAGWAAASFFGRRSREQAILDSLRKIA